MLLVWCLVPSYSAGTSLAIPAHEGALVSASSTSSWNLVVPSGSDKGPVMGGRQQSMNCKVLPSGADVLQSTSSNVSTDRSQLSFRARSGEEVCFQYQHGQWHAEVLSQLGDFSRRVCLPVVCSRGENVSQILATLSSYPSWQSQRRIHVLGQDAVLRGVVYLGLLGLKGGGDQWIRGPEVFVRNVAEEKTIHFHIPQGKRYKGYEAVKEDFSEGVGYEITYVEKGSQIVMDTQGKTSSSSAKGGKTSGKGFLSVPKLIFQARGEVSGKAYGESSSSVDKAYSESHSHAVLVVDYNITPNASLDLKLRILLEDIAKVPDESQSSFPNFGADVIDKSVWER